MGSMQVLAHEKLWAAKRWLSWRNYYEYLSGTLWWLEGIATLFVFLIPATIMLTGAADVHGRDRAVPDRLRRHVHRSACGARDGLFRGHLHWPTAFALRIFRVPIGIACLWWLLTRRELTFEVTPKAGAEERVRGRIPRILVALIVVVTGILVYAAAGLLGWVPWRTNASSTLLSGAWLALADVVLILGTRRIVDTDFSTSRRNAHRTAIRAAVTLDGVQGELVDISVGGVAVRFPAGTAPTTGHVQLELPGSLPIAMSTVRISRGPTVTTSRRAGCWPTTGPATAAMSLWLFHTPPGVVAGMPAGVPAVAASVWERNPRAVSSFGKPLPPPAAA